MLGRFVSLPDRKLVIKKPFHSPTFQPFVLKRINFAVVQILTDLSMYGNIFLYHHSLACLSLVFCFPSIYQSEYDKMTWLPLLNC